MICKKYGALILCGLLLFSLWTTPASAASINDFDDVPSSAWYYKAVERTVSKGIFVGTSATAFEPSADVTRAMFVQMLANYTTNYRAGALPRNSFNDVSRDAWYGNAVNWAYANGLVAGVDKNIFDPNASITREQAAVILYAYALRAGGDASISSAYESYTDAEDVSAWAHAAMCWCIENGIMVGIDKHVLDPKGIMPRAQAAQLFLNAISVLGESPTAVNALSYAKDPVDESIFALGKTYGEMAAQATQVPETVPNRSMLAGGYLFTFDNFPNRNYLYMVDEYFDQPSGYPKANAYPYALLTTASEAMPEIVGLTFSGAIAKTDGVLDIYYNETINSTLWFGGDYLTEHFYYYLALEGSETIQADTMVLVILWSALA